MTLSPHFRPADPVRLPDPERLLGALDGQLKDDARQNLATVDTAAKGPIPTRSGRTRASTRTTLRTSRRGYSVVLTNDKRAHVLRFLEGGTGRRGPTGRTIPKGRRGFLRNVGVPSGRGQAPQKTWTRSLKAARKVTADMERQMQATWDKTTRGIS